jgi:hypothetical protein
MPSITIDGENKIIDIGYDAATTVVDASAIYSRWKDWVQLEGAWADEAFSLSVGGNDLGGGVNLDAYYFLRNDLGWRIRAADQDHKLIINGQLFGFASATAIALARPGRTIVYEYTLSSRSQVVNPAADPTTAASGYQGQVYLDPTSAFSDSDYPTGTSVQPVNNVSSAIAIASKYGLKTLYVLGSLTLIEDVEGLILRGDDAGVLVTVDTAANVLNTVFDGVNVTGYFDGPARIRNATVNNIIDGFVGEMDNCNFTTGITCIGDVNLHNCSSDQPGAGSPFIDLAGVSHDVQIRNYNGSIEVRGMVTGSMISVDLVAGRVIIHSSCTGGNLKVRGVGEPIEDNSGAVVAIDEDGFLHASKIVNPLTGQIWGAS